MKWFILFVGVVVLCGVVALVLGLAGGGMGRSGTALSHEPLPDEPLADTDFDDLVFDVSVRGYRMGQVDGVVDRLRRELREKDEQIAVLRGEVAVAAEDPEADAQPETPTVQSDPATGPERLA
ncbi:cell division protein DivIVA [Terrabacter sp. NPDC000476]|uniref:cell division protein DivIVA n=1 Tax=Terrabacter sp. NPDC000476 TaxID=3154258 RepID=UPI003317069A